MSCVRLLPTSSLLFSTALFVPSLVLFSKSFFSECIHILVLVQFKEFGVLFVSTTVTNVSLPADLSQCLEEASKIDSQLQEATRSQEFKMKQMNDQADLELKEITLQNERQDADLIAQKERLAIEKDARIAEAAAAAERAIVKEQQEAESRKVKATAALRDEQTRARTDVEKMLQKAEQDGKQRRFVGSFSFLSSSCSCAFSSIFFG